MHGHIRERKEISNCVKLKTSQLHSCAIEMLQSLENFVSMAIQGTQVPTYTKHTLFLYFLIFQIFVFYFYEK